MLPTDPWPAWITFGAAIIQTAAAVLQVAQGRRGEHGRRAGRGVSAGVRFGLAALVLEFCGWLVTRNIENDAVALRLAVYAPSVTLGIVAFFVCLASLLTTPDAPAVPRTPNAPIRKEYLPAWHEVMRQRQAQYERDVQESRISPARALSLVLGAVAGLGIAYTGLVFAGVLH